MPAVGDVIEMTSLGITSAAVPVINVFHYRLLPAAEGLTLDQLINSFRTQVVQGITSITATAYLNQGITALNLTDGLEYSADSLSDTGERTGDPMPAFVAASFILRRSSRLTRHGHKRFSPVSETDVTDMLPSAALISACDAFSAVMLAGLTVGIAPPTQVAELVIVRRRSGIVPLYTAVNPVAAVDFRGIGSQNSRKIPFTNA